MVQLRYVVVELKVGRLTPADVGQLSFYVQVVDGQRRLPEHRATVGLLLSTARSTETARYALQGASSALAVVRYVGLEPEERAAFPGEAALAEALAAPVTIAGESLPLAQHLQRLERGAASPENFADEEE